MSEEILTKLHTALYKISPLTSTRERIIGEMGEVIWLDSLEKILTSLPEDVCAKVVAYLNNDELDEAVELMEREDVDLDSIITEVATSVMDDVVNSK